MNQILQKTQDRFFTAFIYISYFLITIAALGLSQLAPQYLSYMDYYVKIYICIFFIVNVLFFTGLT